MAFDRAAWHGMPCHALPWQSSRWLLQQAQGVVVWLALGSRTVKFIYPYMSARTRGLCRRDRPLAPLSDSPPHRRLRRTPSRCPTWSSNPLMSIPRFGALRTLLSIAIPSQILLLQRRTYPDILLLHRLPLSSTCRISAGDQ